MKLVSIIVAVGAELEIGKNNDLMWSLPRDMKFFRDTTIGHPVIMGRKNWDSIPLKYRPLSNRKNIIMTRDLNLVQENAFVTNELDMALEKAWEEEKEEVFIIGGGQIYNLALEKAVVNRMYITHVKGTFSGADAFFPNWQEEEWKKTLLFSKETDERHEFAFDVFQYDKLNS
ncbi:MAG: dihydrofolate reductase [Flavobacteriales bacterium]